MDKFMVLIKETFFVIFQADNKMSTTLEYRVFDKDGGQVTSEVTVTMPEKSELLLQVFKMILDDKQEKKTKKRPQKTTACSG